jgi:hypothetical protein
MVLKPFFKSQRTAKDSCWAHADYEHDRPGQVCGMLPVPEDYLSSMICLSCNGLSEHDHPGQVCGMLPVPEDYLSSMICLSSNGLSGPKWT